MECKHRVEEDIRSSGLDYVSVTVNVISCFGLRECQFRAETSQPKQTVSRAVSLSIGLAAHNGAIYIAGQALVGHPLNIQYFGLDTDAESSTIMSLTCRSPLKPSIPCPLV